MLKVAVIGMGNIGSTHHAPIYHASDLCELVAVCDIIEEKADAAAAKYGVPAYYSVDDLLANEELDAVVDQIRKETGLTIEGYYG